VPWDRFIQRRLIAVRHYDVHAVLGFCFKFSMQPVEGFAEHSARAVVFRQSDVRMLGSSRIRLDKKYEQSYYLTGVEGGAIDISI
jgi:hypothetical protein